MKYLLALIALLSVPADPQVFTKIGGGDPRIQSVAFDAARIIRVSVTPGLQTMVELPRGDQIEVIGVGDSIAWQVSAGERGDLFFIKNVSANTVTNLSVVTSTRVYNFELVPADGYGEISPYHVKVVYPVNRQQWGASHIIKRELEYEFEMSGAKSIRPTVIYQNDMRTILEWPEDFELPATFLMNNGNEESVNGEMLDGRYVILGTPRKLIFRLGSKTAYATRRDRKVPIGE